MDISDYINGGIETGLLGIIIYIVKKYVIPYHKSLTDEIDELREDKQEALIKNAKLEVENKHLEKKKSK